MLYIQQVILFHFKEESDCLDHCSGTYIKIKSNTLPPVKALTHQDNLNQVGISY